MLNITENADKCIVTGIIFYFMTYYSFTLHIHFFNFHNGNVTLEINFL